jgi:hypothetical protein
MSLATIRGIARNSWLPGPDFVFQRDTTGKVTGSQTFSANRQDFYGQIMQAAFRKGTKISVVYPQVLSYLHPLEIDTAECQEEPGGIDKIFVTYVGYIQVDSEMQDRETVYSRNNALEERSILRHPKFLADVTDIEDIELIVKGHDGLYEKNKTASTASNYKIWDVVTQGNRGALIDALAIEWWDFIVTRGIKTYQAATSEWTKSRSNAGGLANIDLEKLGKIDVPDGDPAAPAGMIWFMSGSTESRTVGTASSWSITWTLIDDNDINQKLYGDDE